MATCRGIDVSAYQGTQDWAAHKRAGVVFAFAKASEGQSTHDPRFATHITGIIKAGLVPGAYHFAWPNQSAAREAANYVSAVKPYAGRGFTHWLDLERYSDGRNYVGRSAAQIKAYVTDWIAVVQKAFPGQRVGVYTSASDLAAGHVPAGVPLWYPAYPWGAAEYSRAEAAAQPKPSGRAPIIWQFTSQPIDRSIAYMSAEAFRAWAAGGTTPKEDDTMALTDADLDKIALATWSYMGKKNPQGTGPETRDAYWYDRDTHELVAALTKKVDALQAQPLSDAQISKIAAAVAASPVLANAIADTLAARLKA